MPKQRRNLSGPEKMAILRGRLILLERKGGVLHGDARV